MEKDPNSVEQHAVGAKLDFGKPTPLLCLADFQPALRQLVGQQADFLDESSSVVDACASRIIEVLFEGRISTPALLAALIALQAELGTFDRGKLDLQSIRGVVSSFSDALLSVSMLTAIGAAKYRPSGWKHVPDGALRYSEACARHFLRSFFEKLDPDTKTSHWCCVAWNAAAVLTLEAAPAPIAS